MGKQTDEKIKEKIIQDYEKYYRLAYSYVHNESDALDIVQEGAYKAIKYSHTLKKEEFLGTWIYRIMMNEAVLFLKKNKQQDTILEEITEGKADEYENIDLKRAIENLGEPEGSIIRLRFFEELKIEQIAAILNENVNTVKTKLYRTLKTLKLTLKEEVLL